MVPRKNLRNDPHPTPTSIIRSIATGRVGERRGGGGGTTRFSSHRRRRLGSAPRRVASRRLPGDGGAAFVVEVRGGRVQADADIGRLERRAQPNGFRYFVSVELQHLQIAQQHGRDQRFSATEMPPSRWRRFCRRRKNCIFARDALHERGPARPLTCFRLPAAGSARAHRVRKRSEAKPSTSKRNSAKNTKRNSYSFFLRAPPSRGVYLIISIN